MASIEKTDAGWHWTESFGILRLAITVGTDGLGSDGNRHFHWYVGLRDRLGLGREDILEEVLDDADLYRSTFGWSMSFEDAGGRGARATAAVLDRIEQRLAVMAARLSAIAFAANVPPCPPGMQTAADERTAELAVISKRDGHDPPCARCGGWTDDDTDTPCECEAEGMEP